MKFPKRISKATAAVAFAFCCQLSITAGGSSSKVVGLGPRGLCHLKMTCFRGF